MPRDSESLTGWLATKWLIVAVALAELGLLASFDVRLGIAAGALFGGVAIVWLYLALRYGSLSGARSARRAMVESAEAHARNRRSADEKIRLGAQQRPDAAERP